MMIIYRSHLIQSEIWGGVSQVCHGLDEPQATNVLVIRLHASCKVAGWNAPYFRQHTHHRQYNTILLLIIKSLTLHHLARIVRQLSRTVRQNALEASIYTSSPQSAHDGCWL